MKTADFARGLRFAASVAVMAGMVGCAANNQFAARVTTFQQWPADANGQSFRFEQVPAEQNTLELQSYQALVATQLRRVGLTPAQPWARDARFNVRMSYQAVPFQTWDDVPAPFYGGPAFSYGHFGYGHGFGLGYGMMFPFGGYGPAYTAVPVTAWRHTLEVSIRDASRGDAEVFQGRATHDAGREALARVMPYLVEAVFQDFPLGSGQVRTVRIPVQPGR